MSSDSPVDNDDFHIAPAEGPSRDDAERGLRDRVKLPLADADRELLAARKRRIRFSLRELLATTTFIAIGAAGVTWLPPGMFAGLSGIVVLAMLLLVNLLEDVSRGFKVAVFALILIYASAVVATFATQSR